MTRFRPVLIALTTLSTLAAAPVPPTPPHPSHRPPVVHHDVFNRHLRGVHGPPIGVPSVSTRWAGRWNATAWFALHRGTGVVQGVVHDAEGRPVGDASVRLRDRHGHVLRAWSAKHLTTTGPGGTFTMTHVRAGAYRVRAERSGRSGATPLHLRAGEVAQVAVKV